MLTEKHLETGDLVIVLLEGWKDLVGIVSQPVTPDHPGHVLVHRDGCIFGVQVTPGDVVPAGGSHEGFAQLAYNLIQLGSHVIEARLIV
jgi:hypothetical protein